MWGSRGYIVACVHPSARFLDEGNLTYECTTVGIAQMWESNHLVASDLPYRQVAYLIRLSSF